ncbi:hypothetical protein HanLR1_Chr11g0385011 [Helianthus annuus]|nr:hypothetical protein HanLR1_Chr11g0385011 [Helianthus annuus]
MGKRRVSVSAADNGAKDREDSWKKIFKGLVDMIEDQQRKLEALVEERQFLEKRFKSQQDRWIFDIKLLQDHIFQGDDHEKTLYSCREEAREHSYQMIDIYVEFLWGFKSIHSEFFILSI